MPRARSDNGYLGGAPARAYRLLVEAIEVGDLVTARKAYGRMMERLTGAGRGADDTLSKIGLSLRRGDLMTARRMLAALESKALTVLKGLRETTDLAPPQRLLLRPPAARKPN